MTWCQRIDMVNVRIEVNKAHYMKRMKTNANINNTNEERKQAAAVSGVSGL